MEASTLLQCDNNQQHCICLVRNLPCAKNVSIKKVDNWYLLFVLLNASSSGFNRAECCCCVFNKQGFVEILFTVLFCWFRRDFAKYRATMSRIYQKKTFTVGKICQSDSQHCVIVATNTQRSLCTVTIVYTHYCWNLIGTKGLLSTHNKRLLFVYVFPGEFAVFMEHFRRYQSIRQFVVVLWPAALINDKTRIFEI